MRKPFKIGNYIITSNLNSNKVIDVEGDIIKNTTNIDLWQKNGGNNQKFIITYLNDGYYTIKAFNSNKVLAIQNNSGLNGANVVQEYYKGKDSQKWAIETTGSRILYS